MTLLKSNFPLVLLALSLCLIAVKATFNCSSLHQDCVNFTYTKNYFETFEDRLESLNKFLNDYLVPNNQILKKAKFVIVEEGDDKVNNTKGFYEKNHV
jgi:hypothetical protein